ncbi:hypothetical protein CgunFtcFv8_018799 [Champsocephalus gunnari]|uniref:Uncharacterized protein n=1 Tax=Champsocephalus gunnari TaxID=52237 RepID=A0AAN8BU64_CHAGU|nr:hypothetical protein CgunFtcFv8_018799 [Champsocephalus gunnari]
MPQLPLQVKQDGLRDTDTPPPAKKAKLTAMEEIFQDEDDVMVTHVVPPPPVRLRIQHEILKFKCMPKLKSTDDIIAFWGGGI